MPRGLRTNSRSSKYRRSFASALLTDLADATLFRECRPEMGTLQASPHAWDPDVIAAGRPDGPGSGRGRRSEVSDRLVSPARWMRASTRTTCLLESGVDAKLSVARRSSVACDRFQPIKRIELVVENFDESAKGNAEGHHPSSKLQNVQIALTSLKLADFALCNAEPCGEFNLSHRSRLPCFRQQAQQQLLLPGIDSLCHGPDT